MVKGFIIFALFCFTVFAGRHEDIIYGSVEPTEEDFNSLYEHFLNNYHDKSHYIYKAYPDVDRK